MDQFQNTLDQIPRDQLILGLFIIGCLIIAIIGSNIAFRYEHWLWDDQMYPPRHVSGFLKKDELVLLHQRRRTRKSLDNVDVDEAIAGRFYQQRAIRRVGEAFEKDRQRNALLVMATGSGKTRTVIAQVDQMMRRTGFAACCFWLTGGLW